jgi:hypothetical protein
LQIIRLAHIFISSYFQIYTLVFVEALNFWSFCGTCPEHAEGRQKDGDDLRHLSYSLLLKLYNCIPYFSFPGGQKKSSPREAGQAPKGPWKARYNPIARIAVEARSVRNPSHLG